MITFFKKNFFIWFAVAFLIPVVIIGVFLFAGPVKHEQLLKTGIETTAYIKPSTYSTNTTVMGEEMYSVGYYFYDEHGDMHDGRTSESYTYSEIRNIIKKDTILIKYDPNTFDSVEAFYNPSHDTEKIILIVFMSLFGLVDLILWGTAIKKGIYNIRSAYAIKNGQTYRAMVTDYRTNMTVNDKRLYKIQYTWKDSNGDIQSTWSPSEYSMDQAIALKEAQTIEIKAIGNKSAIITNPYDVINGMMNKHEVGYDASDDNETTGYEVHNDKVGKKSVCNYCGGEVDSKDKFCPTCGARIDI